MSQSYESSNDISALLNIILIKLNLYKKQNHVQALLSSALRQMEEMNIHSLIKPSSDAQEKERLILNWLKIIHVCTERMAKAEFFGCFGKNISFINDISIIFSNLNQISANITSIFPDLRESEIFVELHKLELENIDDQVKLVAEIIKSREKEVNHRALTKEITCEYAYIFWGCYFPCENVISGSQFKRGLQEIFQRVKNIKLGTDHLQAALDFVDPKRHNAITSSDVDRFFVHYLSNDGILREFLFQTQSSGSGNHIDAKTLCENSDLTLKLTVKRVSKEISSSFQVGQVFQITQNGIKFTPGEKKCNIFLGDEPGVVRFGRKGDKYISENDVYFNGVGSSISRRQFQIAYLRNIGKFHIICLGSGSSHTGLVIKEGKQLALNQNMIMQVAGQNQIIIEKISYRFRPHSTLRRNDPSVSVKSNIRTLEKDAREHTLFPRLQVLTSAIKDLSAIGTNKLIQKVAGPNTFLKTYSSENSYGRLAKKKKGTNFLSLKVLKKEGDVDFVSFGDTHLQFEQDRASIKKGPDLTATPISTAESSSFSDVKEEKISLIGFLVKTPTDEEKRFYFRFRQSQVLYIGRDSLKKIRISDTNTSGCECEIHYDYDEDKFSVKVPIEQQKIDKKEPVVILYKNRKQFEADSPSDAFVLVEEDQLHVEGTYFEVNYL